MKPIYTEPHDVQDERPVGYDADDREIFHNETTYFWEGRWVVQETFVAAVVKLLKENPQQVALEMQIDMKRYT